jgi:hypothetical protein
MNTFTTAFTNAERESVDYVALTLAASDGPTIARMTTATSTASPRARR